MMKVKKNRVNNIVIYTCSYCKYIWGIINYINKLWNVWMYNANMKTRKHVLWLITMNLNYEQVSHHCKNNHPICGV